MGHFLSACNVRILRRGAGKLVEQQRLTRARRARAAAYRRKGLRKRPQTNVPGTLYLLVLYVPDLMRA